MIATCPNCSSRYRLDEDKIPGRGARITCPSCSHKFVVYRPKEQRVVIGAAPPRGLPVTIQKKGQLSRADFEDEDDAEAPTTIMAHGSTLAQEIRKAIEDAATPAPAPLRGDTAPMAEMVQPPALPAAPPTLPFGATSGAAADPVRPPPAPTPLPSPDQMRSLPPEQPSSMTPPPFDSLRGRPPGAAPARPPATPWAVYLLLALGAGASAAWSMGWIGR
jgi:predicted Zn finger-like uncharacterized protein